MNMQRSLHIMVVSLAAVVSFGCQPDSNKTEALSTRQQAATVPQLPSAEHDIAGVKNWARQRVTAATGSGYHPSPGSWR
jgi:hypothetical protein